jgi:aubergine
MKGFKTAIEYYQSGPRILIDCSRRIIRGYDMKQEMDFFRDVRKIPINEILDEFVIDKIFMTTYGNNRMYKVVEVDKTKTPLSLFPDQNKAKTYKEYYKK